MKHILSFIYWAVCGRDTIVHACWVNWVWNIFELWRPRMTKTKDQIRVHTESGMLLTLFNFCVSVKRRKSRREEHKERERLMSVYVCVWGSVMTNQKCLHSDTFLHLSSLVPLPPFLLPFLPLSLSVSSLFYSHQRLLSTYSVHWGTMVRRR